MCLVLIIFFNLHLQQTSNPFQFLRSRRRRQRDNCVERIGFWLLINYTTSSIVYEKPEIGYRVSPFQSSRIAFSFGKFQKKVALRGWWYSTRQAKKQKTNDTNGKFKQKLKCNFSLSDSSDNEAELFFPSFLSNEYTNSSPITCQSLFITEKVISGNLSAKSVK